MKKLLYITLTIIALALLYVRLRYSSPNSTVSPSPTAVTSPTPSPTPTLSATLDNNYFTLSYAPEATVSTHTAPDSREWVISYMGEEQLGSGRTQTELWDGYSVVITRFEVTGDDPAQVQADVDRQGIIDACGQENVTEIKTTTLSAHPALTYVGGCLGSAEYYYLMIADTLYRVTVMTTGSEKYLPTYQDATQAMLASLHFK